MTVNQVVAWNLRRARKERGWTMKETASRLEKRLGRRWSVASFSSAEHSADEDATRKREFDANELVALALTFGKTVAWFLTLPDGADRVFCGQGVPVCRFELEEVTPGGGISNDEAIGKLEAVVAGLKRETHAPWSWEP